MATDPDLPLLMVRVIKQMVAELTEAAGDASRPGLTPVHSLVTRYVEANPGATMVQVAGHLGITKQSASELVVLLESEGLVERRPNPLDGRSRVIDLTAAGRAGIARSRELWAEAVGRWSALVGPDDLAVVQRALEAYLAGPADP